jgi:hypothetical protein
MTIDYALSPCTELSNSRAKYFPAPRKFIHYKNQTVVGMRIAAVVTRREQPARKAL